MAEIQPKYSRNERGGVIMEKEKLNLDSKLLKPIKVNLEIVINRLMNAVLMEDKEAEINLKIQIDKSQQEKYYK